VAPVRVEGAEAVPEAAQPRASVAAAEPVLVAVKVLRAVPKRVA
jgi:hypothetical protein